MATYGGQALKCLVALHLFIALTLVVVSFRSGTLKAYKPDDDEINEKQASLLFWAAVLLIVASVVIGLKLAVKTYDMIVYGVKAKTY